MLFLLFLHTGVGAGAMAVAVVVAIYILAMSSSSISMLLLIYLAFTINNQDLVAVAVTWVKNNARKMCDSKYVRTPKTIAILLPFNFAVKIIFPALQAANTKITFRSENGSTH